MKNDPLLTFNHMEEEGVLRTSEKRDSHIPMSVVMIIVTDMLIMATIFYLVFRFIF